jgi:DNA polymerase-3 subunit gamma/tau
MAYQVIARKWRPQAFEEVTGQEAITRTLRGAIEHERLHHAYLFSGARGVGKTTTARLLAKAVNCHRADRPTPTPCSFADENACPSCREIAEGRSIDVLEIDAASNTGVDNVRDAIINTVGVRPARDRYKVFIIDEVHMLSGAAFNALLKTLEEPPPRVLFIMATTESHKVPDTILSRCQQFEFRTIATARIAERLRLIADAERVDVSDEALREIARAGEGSMRDAQSAFDQVISFSDGRIGTEEVETALGIAGAELRARVMRSVADEAPSEAVSVVADLVARGHDLRNFCRDLLAHLRDLLVVKVAGDGGAGVLDATEQERRALQDEAARFSESDLVRFFHSLTETEKHLRESVHPRYQLEIGLVKLVEMRRLASLSRILERLDALERSLGGTPAGTGGASSPPASAAGGGSAAPRRSGSAGGGGTRGMSGTNDANDAHAHAPAQNSSAAADANADSATTATTTKTDETTRETPPARTFAPPRVPSFAPKTTHAPPGATHAHAPSQPPASASGLKLVGTPPAPSSTSPAHDTRDDAPFPVSRPSAPTPKEPAPFPVANNAAPFAYTNSAAHASAAAEPSFFDPSPPDDDALTHVDEDSHQSQPEAKTDDVSRIKRALDERRKPFLAIALEEARRVSVEGDELCVEFAPEAKHLRDTLAKADNVRIVREVCCDVLGREMGVRILVKEAGEADDAPPTQQDEERLEKQRLREWAEAQPVVQKLLKTFRAQIVDVSRIDGEQAATPPPRASK